jgi:hypothetical protein
MRQIHAELLAADQALDRALLSIGESTSISEGCF